MPTLWPRVADRFSANPPVKLTLPLTEWKRFFDIKVQKNRVCVKAFRRFDYQSLIMVPASGVEEDAFGASNLRCVIPCG